MQKKVIVASFDNVLLNPGPVHMYAALRAYRKVLEEGLVKDHTKFKYNGFLKQDINASEFLNSSLYFKGFFCIAFDKLRHLAKNEDDYLKMLMLIEKNKDLAIKLQSSANSEVYKMFADAILDNPIELGKESIGRISVDKVTRWRFSTVFREAIRDLNRYDKFALLRMYSSDSSIVPQLRQIVAKYPVYFVTMQQQEIVGKLLEGLLKLNYLADSDFKQRDIKWVYSESLLNDWRWEYKRRYLVDDNNILTLETSSFLPIQLKQIAAKEEVKEKDVWFLTRKFDHKTAKALFEAGFRRQNDGAPQVNIFVIAASQPFIGQYREEMAAGVLVLEHDKFAEKLLKIASIYK
ncbi:MAG: hypothetical protein QXS93_02160 [Candidatus Micrarchaeia archaeon]